MRERWTFSVGAEWMKSLKSPVDKAPWSGHRADPPSAHPHFLDEHYCCQSLSVSHLGCHRWVMAAARHVASLNVSSNTTLNRNLPASDLIRSLHDKRQWNQRGAKCKHLVQMSYEFTCAEQRKTSRLQFHFHSTESVGPKWAENAHTHTHTYSVHGRGVWTRRERWCAVCPSSAHLSSTTAFHRKNKQDEANYTAPSSFLWNTGRLWQTHRLLNKTHTHTQLEKPPNISGPALLETTLTWFERKEHAASNKPKTVCCRSADQRVIRLLVHCKMLHLTQNVCLISGLNV